MKLVCEFDKGSASRASLGLIVLQGDETIESEFRSLFDLPGVGLFHARIASDERVTPETLKQMAMRIPATAALLPASQNFDVIGYACTSASTVIGEDKVRELVQQAHGAAQVSNPVSAVMAAMRALAARRVGLVTPYVAEISKAMKDLLENNGFEVAAFGSFEQVEDAAVARITSKSLLEAICKVGADENVDAVFASCTNLRSFEIIEQGEAVIGKPVVTSNQALGWHMAKLAGLGGVAKGPGRLFAL